MESMGSKAEDQRRHALRRASERYGLTLSPGQYDELCHRIRHGQDGAVFLDRQSNRVSMWAVRHGLRWLPVIYDSRRHQIVTFLPVNTLISHLGKVPIGQQGQETAAGGQARGQARQKGATPLPEGRRFPVNAP